MLRKTLLMMVVCWLGVAGGAWVNQAHAAEPYWPRSWWSIHDPCCYSVPYGPCCDDYCRKPPPRIPCRIERSGCDDYCRRPAPCVSRPALTCADDYDCKPLPRLCGPRPPHAVCVPYCAHVSDSPTSPTHTVGRAKIQWIR